MPQTLTVLASIRRGEEDALRAVMRPIGDDIRGTKTESTARPRIEFSRSSRIHFARFGILPDPERGHNRARLLYSANYDGSFDDHLAELIAITSDLDAIWRHCEGYAGAEQFDAFVRARMVAPHAYYIAFRNETAASICDAVTRKRHTGAARGNRPGGIDATIQRLRRALPIGRDLVRAVARCGFVNVFRGSQLIVASLGRYPLFRLSNWLTGNRMPRRHSRYSSVPLENRVARVVGGLPPSFREDVVAQNQLTLLTTIAPGGADRVRAVMAAIDSYAKRLSPPGSLVGVSTIHFVKWTIIDEGRRLLMISDYDGSWESYIDEFAEMILSGLDAIWTTAEGYPRDGARDVPAFKRFLRSHQVPSEIFFSAYPDATVLNIGNAL